MRNQGDVDITNNLTVSGVVNLIDSHSGFIEQPASGTSSYTLEQKAPVKLTLLDYTTVTSAGSFTSSITIDDVLVTGLSHLAVNNSEDTYTATANRTVNEGQTLKLTASGASAAQNFAFTLRHQRVS